MFGVIRMVKKFLIRLILLINILLLWSAAASAGKGDDAVIEFYLKKADSVMAVSYIFNSSLHFTFMTKTIYYLTDSRGNTKKVDTAVFMVEYNERRMMSVTVIDSARIHENILPKEITPAPLWEQHLAYYFFPNDTGVGQLAIGFDPAASYGDKLPSGFLSLDRDTYYLSSLKLNYPGKEGYIKYSEAYNFEPREGFLVPRRLEIHGAWNTFLSQIYFRQNLEFYDFRIK
jgi:hypothetical protein